MKKLCSVICAASVALSLAVPAFATEQTSILGSTPGEVAVVEELLKNPEATPAPSEATPGEVETSEEASNTAEITESVEINEANFPDAIFRQYVADHFDKDKDAILSPEEIAGVQGVYVFRTDVKNLKGIEFFVNLQTLSCSENLISNLDVSKNTKLKTLSCSKNPITKLDLSNNLDLEWLQCSGTQISELNIIEHKKLRDLSCDQTKITELDVSHNPDLRSLDFSETQISELDLSKNSHLSSLRFYDTDISEIDLSNNPELTYLYCDSSAIKQLDLSSNTSLQGLYCSSTLIEDLDLSNNQELKFFNCYGSDIRHLDLSKNTKLTQLICTETKITELDLSRNTELEYLLCDNSSLNQLNVDNCSKLKDLDCSNTNLDSLDLSDCVALWSLQCYNTNIKELNLKNNRNIGTYAGEFGVLRHHSFAVELQGEYALSNVNSEDSEWGRKPVYKIEDTKFSLKEQATSMDLDRVKEMNLTNGATWNAKTGSVENIADGVTEVSYVYTTGGINKDTKQPIEAVITFTLQKGEAPVPTATPAPSAQPTATPAPTTQPTATPAPTSAPVPTATPVPGTPGEVVGGKADQLLKDPSNTQLANDIVAEINNNKSINVTSKVANAVANAIRYNPMNLGASKDGIQFGATLHKDNSGFVLVPESAAIEGDRAQVSLHFEDGKGNVVQPKLGGLVTVKIPGKTMPAGDYVLVGEGNRMIDSVTVTTVGNDTVISFWAPHFSTYAIVPRSAYVAPSDNNNGGSTAGNPIKATGLDMSMALMGVVAMAGVAVVGGAAVAKKAKKD